MANSISVKTKSRIDMVDITASVQKEVSKAGVKDAFCVVYVPHTTAGITINEGADPAVCQDIIAKLNELAPANAPEYTHMEGNSDSHIKSAVIGNSRTIIVKDEKLLLGIWEGVMFAEFDGPRNRNIIISIK